jgi:hypothetical protein
MLDVSSGELRHSRIIVGLLGDILGARKKVLGDGPGAVN